MAALSAIPRRDDRGLALGCGDDRADRFRGDKGHVAGHHKDRVALGLRYALLYGAEHPARRVRVLDGSDARVEHRVDVTFEIGSGVLSDNHDHLGDATVEKRVDRVIEEWLAGDRGEERL